MVVLEKRVLLLLVRKLDHPHIVQLYGTSLLKDMNTSKLILVMEKCKGNLRSHISQHPESVPGKAEHRQTEGGGLSAPLEACSRGTVIREV